jgi:hypothetical protein
MIDSSDYEVFKVFLPNYASENYSEMMEFLESIQMSDDFWFESIYSPDKTYYLEWIDSGHERDSSGDCLTVWKRENRNDI